MSYRTVFENYFSSHAHDCALWAFGEGFENLPPDDLLERWNALHSDIFKLEHYGLIASDVKRICKEWEKLRLGVNPLD